MAWTHCCERMADLVEQKCDRHPDRYDCPDILVDFIPKFREYGIIIHDGGNSKLSIHFCPWCGTRLPDTERERWFDAMDDLGIDPWTDEVPSDYRDDTWLKDAT